MNRCTKLVVAVLAFAVAATPASAQNLSAFVGGGVTLPIGDFGDVADTGWNVGGGVLVPVGAAGMWVGGEAFYGRNSVKDISPGLDFGDWTLTGAGALLGYTINPMAQMSPFVFGSLGFLSLGMTGEGSGSESGVSFGAGAGLSFNLTPTISAWGAGRFINARIDGDNLQFIPLNVGLTFSLGGN
jgi:hypothetical protein